MISLQDFLQEWNSPSPTIKVHTSGSTGKPKEMTVEKERMIASAKMTCDYLGLRQGDTALLCMPLDYIAGKMVVVRTIERQMRLISVQPSSHPLSEVRDHVNFAAFVPLQVAKTLEDEQEAKTFATIDHVIIGGASIDRDLEAKLRTCANNIYSTYGMTETLSHIALRRLNGPEASEWYTPLQGVTLSRTEEGCLIIDAPHVCKERLVTNDIVEMDAQGRFRVLGRKDNVINTGGVKVQIEEAEEKVREIVSHSDFMITSCPDSTFGEIIVLLIPKNMPEPKADILLEALDYLPRYWQPKRIVLVDSLPYTETGKPDRAMAKMLAK